MLNIHIEKVRCIQPHIAVTLGVIMVSLQDPPGYMLRNHRHWWVNSSRYHNNNQDKLLQQYQGHKQLWIALGQGEQRMGNPPWFRQEEPVKSHRRVQYQIIKHQGQFMLHQLHRWRVLGVLQIPLEQSHTHISSKNLVKFQIMTLAWILKHGSIVMRWP